MKLDDLLGDTLGKQCQGRTRMSPRLIDRSARASSRANCMSPRKSLVQQPLENHQELNLRFGTWRHQLLVPVRRVVGDYPADAAAGIGHVALPARNDVDMRVRNRLLRRQTVVEPDVEAIRLVLGEQPYPHLAH